MSGPSGVMGCFFLPRLKRIIVLLLASANIVCLHGNPTTGVNHDLHCVNDYLFTINCSLTISPSENYSYWLTIIETYEREKSVCMLTNTNGDYFCSVKRSNQMPDDEDYLETFVDTDTFEISLCHNQHDGSDICEQLDSEYEVVSNIKPNAPCCLTVSHSSSQHHFTWRSTYEEYDLVPGLGDSLKYQLRYYKRGDKDKVSSHLTIYTNSVNCSVDDEKFAPGTEYAARVRTSPEQVFYKGQWSDWSPTVYWETAVNDLPSDTFVSGLGKGLIPLFVLLPFVLIFCYLPVKTWRQSIFIPTPAPYFHTLYSDCQGDFKSWVVTQENTAAVPKVEETLQIDTLTKFVVVEKDKCQFHHQFIEGRAYNNITDPGCDASLLGMPYAVSTMTPPANPGSLNSPACSPAEGDSGCWMERDPPRYCNEYCTLSSFQQSGLVTAEHHGEPPTKFCPTGITRVEAITEA